LFILIKWHILLLSTLLQRKIKNVSIFTGEMVFYYRFNDIVLEFHFKTKTPVFSYLVTEIDATSLSKQSNAGAKPASGVLLSITSIRV